MVLQAIAECCDSRTFTKIAEVLRVRAEECQGVFLPLPPGEKSKTCTHLMDLFSSARALLKDPDPK